MYVSSFPTLAVNILIFAYEWHHVIVIILLLMVPLPIMLRHRTFT